MSKVTVTQITIEFLSGNLLEDATGYDSKASADRYAEQCMEALEAVYPAADINISYQDGHNPRADDLWKTQVMFSDGSTLQSGDRGDAEIIEAICEGVYNEQEWLVESGEDAG
ncbi:MAG: hypothetical protein QM758_05740 [Armatimonas sp.]